MSPQK